MDRAQSVLSRSPNNLCQALECCKEKGASSWLSVIPVAQHGFAFHKTDFTDALCLHYDWSPPHLPSHCVCGKVFTISHALSCPHGAFPIIRHNDVGDLTAKLMSEVCHDVQVESHLQPLSGELLHHKTAKHEDDARVDIRAAEKRRAYEERIQEVERGSFTPLVFSSSGGMGKAATVTYKRLASLLSDKWNSPVMGWLRCSLGFSLLRSSLMHLCGSRSSSGSPGVLLSVDLAVAEGHLATNDV